MKVLVFPDAATASAATAARIVARLHDNPRAVLGLATGGTMEPVYAALRRDLAGGPVAFTAFNLDEYVGLPADHPQSYASYMRAHFYDALGVPAAQTHLPRGDAPDPQAEADRYEAAIKAAGGIDLQLLGLGANGHIGFNEPISSLGSRTRVKTLARKTVNDNARFFRPGEEVPHQAITMGIATILEAREILLLTTGKTKSRAVAQMIEGPVSAICPASALQMHPRVTVLLDTASAADLSLREYYEIISKPGPDNPETL
ncbi:glucosamine-6-phosphate deaminase [Paracoccus benzoatiresistens]|uniref:Glucosamine-6-phosphate deaminase n=1 Tax=Paracoccus benzoatiresistens TaxID=2997341 RepID=A0ABT4J6L9_9RHOB|nr:glucosamine-6-phosphate deaminase [Paracoccus sp. EF6]MCZ0962544.1 glucosamine-6-phosphate deaminase [Paracoccus sp. EF6]